MTVRLRVDRTRHAPGESARPGDKTRDVFGDDMPPEPAQTPLSLIHAWTG